MLTQECHVHWHIELYLSQIIVHDLKASLPREDVTIQLASIWEYKLLCINTLCLLIACILQHLLRIECLPPLQVNEISHLI